MKTLVPTTAYRKNIKRVKKRGYDLSKLVAVLKTEVVPVVRTIFPLR